jgi:hypothetical protein
MNTQKPDSVPLLTHTIDFDDDGINSCSITSNVLTDELNNHQVGLHFLYTQSVV